MIAITLGNSFYESYLSLKELIATCNKKLKEKNEKERQVEQERSPEKVEEEIQE